jgi:hypothetical protein
VYKRDILLEEIEKLGQIIGRLLEKLRGRDPGDFQWQEPIFEEALNGQLDLNLEELLQQSDTDFLDNITRRFHHNEALLDQFATLLVETGYFYPKKRFNAWNKARILLIHIQNKSPVYSIDRQERIREIEKSFK